ncbi:MULTISPECIES: restriction endonuclease subunit S [Methanohalophilus]|uniref:Restriction endonuclease subunit S n=1 Tax=Methanohalophilus euhalobius TaxID=51203 RepID=A0A315B8C1_9EURY|nr:MULTISPECIES: restriction endonuclease subunit S [Methanohalophilus]PQV42369.1 type I restriction enzyme S subunit [Methanohalophilus euhalobius]RNI08125.1 restriction endonuclease subunit S [Methanohalophilus euhalobius]
MTSEWKEFCWGDIATLEYGKSLRNYKKSTGQYPVFGTNGQIGTCDKPLVDDEGVIIGRKGAYREVHFSKDPFFVIDTAFYLKLNDPTCVDISFAYYQLLNLDINSLDSGSAIPSTSREDFYSLPVKLPPIEEQHRIVEILKSLDDKIELNRRMNVTLEQIAQAIFKQWFIDFEFPDENGQPYKSSGGEMVESGLGEIPRGWEVKAIGDILELAYGKSLPKKKRISGPYPVYGSGGISGYHNKPLLNGPGIIVGRKGTIGSVFWVEKDFYPIDTVFFVKLKSQIPLYWVFMNLQRMNFAKLSSDSGVPGVNRNVIHFQKWVIPQKTVLDQFNSIILSILIIIHKNKKEEANLSHIRDTLLPKLMSGKIRISEKLKLEKGLI